MRSTKMMVFIVLAAAAGVHASELLYTGNGSSLWSDNDSTIKNWNTPPTPDGNPVRYYQNDDVLFSDTLIPAICGTIVSMSRIMTPGNLVFDITNTLRVINNGTGALFFGATNIVKTGSGSVDWCLWGGNGNNSTTPVQIKAGTLILSAPNSNNYAPRNGNTREYIVDAGAELRVTNRNSIGKADQFTLQASGGAVVKVKSGGRMSMYIPDGVAPDNNSVWELHLDGGSHLDFLAKGMNTQGAPLLRVLHGLYVAGSGAVCITQGFSPYTGAAYTYQDLGICSNETTIIDVADTVPGPDMDLYMNLPFSNPGTVRQPLLVKQGAGTFRLACTKVGSTFKADVLVKDGTLQLDYPPSGTVFGESSKTLLGDLTVEGRTITIADSGQLAFLQRNMFSSYSYGADGNNKIKSEVVVTNGGTIAFGTGEQGYNCFGPLTLHDGNMTFGAINYSWAAFGVRGTMKIRGTKPLVLKKAGTTCDQILYPGYATTFDVDDITHDSLPDFVSDLCITIPGASYRTNSLGVAYEYGFIKTGGGTMNVLADCSGSNGQTNEVRVQEGTMQVDGKFHLKSTVVVSAGAYLSGTGTVGNVTLAAGGGFRQTCRGGSATMTIAGNLSIGANPVIMVDNPDAMPVKKVKASVFKATGTVTGAENLANATVLLDGVDIGQGRWSVDYDAAAKSLAVKAIAGLVINLK